MLLSMLIAECLSKFKCTFIARLDAATYFFQLLECSIAYLLNACHVYMEQLATTSVYFRSCTELTYHQ